MKRLERAKGEMRSGRQPHHSLGAALGAMLLVVPATLIGCAAPSSYAGISLAPGKAEPELQQLARLAQEGDKRAQLALGIRYEQGRGVPVDLRRAAALYRRAATDSGGIVHVYVPPVGKSGRGRIVPVRRGPAAPGLDEARLRLERLRQLRSRGDAE